MCLVSLFDGDKLLYKYYAYKIGANGVVTKQVYQILTSRDHIVNDPPPLYDIPTYTVLISSYQFPDPPIRVIYGIQNDFISDKLTTLYKNELQLSIQRVYKSPTGNDIITPNSRPIKITPINEEGLCPEFFEIPPITEDNKANGFTSFFVPKGTILNFSKLLDVTSDYSFADEELMESPSTSLGLTNGADSMFNSTLRYNNLLTLQQLNKTRFQTTMIAQVPTNRDDKTMIPFSAIYNLL